MKVAQVTLKKGKEQSVKRYHPWIFSGAVSRISGSPAGGDLVEVWSSDGSYLATGHWSPGSIAVRILSFTQCDIDRDFFRKKLADAYAYRASAGIVRKSGNTAWRLVHGEGDGLPGLIIDVYGDVAVIQAHSAGFWRIREMIAELLIELFYDTVRSVYDKSEATFPFMTDQGLANGFIAGEDAGDSTIIIENGFKFRVNWKTGQKTGFFIDQRDNRDLLRQYSEGRTVLNMFGYTGGFSVYAMSNASVVHTVDSSASAIEQAEENIKLNYGNDNRHRSYTADAFRFLAEMGCEYDLIVLDPPAFAKHHVSLDRALQGYRRLNAAALEKIRSGGILFTFSCSQVVNRDDFRRSVFVASASTRRNVRILHQTGQPADHPVNIFHPESEYLKGLVLYVE